MFGPIGIVDYGCGNLHSVLSAFEFLGAEAELITAPEDFEQFESFILPVLVRLNMRKMDQLYQRVFMYLLLRPSKVKIKSN